MLALSSESEFDKDKKKLTIEVNRSQEIDDLNEKIRTLENEKESLETVLTTIADKELIAKAKAYGIDITDITTDEAIERIKNAELKHHGISREEPQIKNSPYAEGQQVEKPIIEDNEGFDSIEELLEYYVQKQNSQNPAESAMAKEVVKQLEFKLLNQPHSKPLDLEIDVAKLRKLKPIIKKEVKKERKE